MSSVIQNLLDSTVGDGARPSKFECFIQFKDISLFPNSRDLISLVKTSQFPGKSNDVIDLKFKGRTIPIKGQVKYDNTWTCTFYTTPDHALKKAFEDWIESLDQQHNIKQLDSKVKQAQSIGSSIGYASNMRIAQLDFSGSQETAIYTLYDCFPKSVSAINVDYSNIGTILEFTVEFSYSYYDTLLTKTILGSFVDDIKSQALGAVSSIFGEVNDMISGVFNNIVTEPINAVKSFASDSISSVQSEISSGIGAIDNMFTKFDW